jgi:hypothetical protein
MSSTGYLVGQYGAINALVGKTSHHPDVLRCMHIISVPTGFLSAGMLFRDKIWYHNKNYLHSKVNIVMVFWKNYVTTNFEVIHHHYLSR